MVKTRCPITGRFHAHRPHRYSTRGTSDSTAVCKDVWKALCGKPLTGPRVVWWKELGR